MARFGDSVNPPEKEGKEKHVPQIEAPSKVKAGEPFQVTVIVGKEVPHPNTVEHHIKWIQVYSKEDGPRGLVHVATFDLGPTYAEPRVTFTMKLEKSSTLYVLEYCNVHGVWDNSFKIEVE
ncbi:TPA: desulfoferrodoxin [Candidatus Poribacteria bacterium]|nr:desulfoferrodoxin [Candidatus Poribacteria bacterium]